MNKQQLANRIWASANKLRSKIEANEYKDYILGLIFYKFLCDKQEETLKNDLSVPEENFEYLTEDFEDPDMANLIRECQSRIGYYIEYKNLFNKWLKDTNFNVATLAGALSSFERLMTDNYENVYKGIFATLGGGLTKLGENPSAQTKALKELINLIKDIPTNGSEDYDVLGYVYEYLISNFAATAGKKAGEFYTPHEVAMVMSEIVADHHKEKDHMEIYDPTSGSGSLLITIGKAVSKHMTDSHAVKYYAQELMENTYNLTRMNLVMRGILPQNIITRCADSLEEDWPIHEDGVDIAKPLAVDAVVSNPPYSQHWNPKDMESDPRFQEYGVAPKTKADYAFLLHELHHLKSDGIMSIVLPHGVLFRGKAPKIYDENGKVIDIELREEGQGEGIIRSQLIEKNNIDAIIGLPAGIFFGTGIPTLIMILKKNRGNEGILFIDASKGFVKDGKQNRLRACDIKRISDTYKKRISIPGYSREVTRDEIRRNEYNLNIPRYVDSTEKAEQYDIYATMFGGIPEREINELSEFWEVFPSLRQELFEKEEDKPYFSLKNTNIDETISTNVDVANFRQQFNEAFGSFRDMMKIRLIDHIEDVHEVAELDNISEDIMHRASKVPLLDPYDVYQILSDHWTGIMNDIDIIQTEGYAACNVVEPNYKIVKRNDVDVEVIDGQKGRIMPFDLVQNMFLSEELANLKSLDSQRESMATQLNELLETLDSDEQELLLNDDNTKWDSKAITKAYNNICEELDIKGNSGNKKKHFNKMNFELESTEYKIQKVMALQDRLALLRKEISRQELQLELDTIVKIESLEMKEIIALLQQKWIEPIAAQIDALPNDVISSLSETIKYLGAKYSETYMDIEDDIKTSKNNLSNLIKDLTGDKFAIEGLLQLVSSNI